LLLQQIVAFGEVVVAKEAPVRRQGRWMHRGQDMVFFLQEKLNNITINLSQKD
jgi:hypothetical protein